MIITFGGMPGSGKSTIAKRLASLLGYKRYYMGQIFRDFAKKRGMTMEEFGKYCEQHPEMDRKVDAYQATLGKRHKNLVVEGRTSYYFIPHSIKIFLAVSTRVGSQRIIADMQKNRKRNEVRSVQSLSSFERSVKRRIVSEKKRYRKWFGIDPFQKKNYDLYLDTTRLTKEQVFDRVLTMVKEKRLVVNKKSKKIRKKGRRPIS